MSLSTHVLDAVTGRPAAGVPVALRGADGTELAIRVTDGDGRILDFGTELAPSVYSLRFDVAAYLGPDAFYPEVVVTFRLGDGHHHVPLLLSPFAYSTYRGS